MSKPEWGVKRTCQSCGARFYDLQRTPILCPKCGSNVEPEVTFKPRRHSSPPPEPKVAPVILDDEAVEIETEELEVVEPEDGEVEAIEAGDDDESGLIEDASDLGEDDDDMAEVMEHIDEDLEDEV